MTTGLASVMFTDEELLIIWQSLTRLPTTENAEIRRRVKKYLEEYSEKVLQV